MTRKSPPDPTDAALVTILNAVRTSKAFSRMPVQIRDNVNWAWVELRRRNDPGWLEIRSGEPDA